MRPCRNRPRDTGPGRCGVTLIELLVVVAVISCLIAVLLPALSWARKLGQRTTCQGHLRQIALAWQMYLEDHEGAFYRAVNAQHTYGGWKGLFYPNRRRPLNRYVGLDALVEREEQARLFRCPADKDETFYTVGTSYQTNILLVGQPRIGGLEQTDTLRQLRDEINKRLPELRDGHIEGREHVALMGDSPWNSHWMPNGREGAAWHGRPGQYNVAFLDAHVRFLRVRASAFVTDEYRVIPFHDLRGLAREAQQELQQSASK